MHLKLGRAYETIKDPTLRRLYDQKWEIIRTRKQAQRKEDERQSEAAKAKQNSEASEDTRRRSAALARIIDLEQQKNSCQTIILESTRVARRLEGDLERLKEQDAEDVRKDRARDNWLTYLTSPWYPTNKETETQKQARDADRIRRLVVKRVRESEKSTIQSQLGNLKDRLGHLETMIAAEKKVEADELRMQNKRRQAQAGKEQEIRRRAEGEEIRKRQEEFRAKLRREQAARDKEARETQEARARAEKATLEEQTRMARERVAKAQADLRARTRADQTPGQASSHASRPTPQASCLHKAFWDRVEGGHTCSNCHGFQHRFAFKCPTCSKIACANCRQLLRGEKKQGNKRTGPRFASS